MSRAHHRAPSKADRERELRDLGQSKNPDIVLMRLRSGDISLARAARLLEGTTLKGLLWAGEIALELASRDCDPDQVVEHLTFAQEKFTMVADRTRGGGRKRLRGIAARAGVQSAHIPAYASVALKGQLPTVTPVAESIYGRLVSIGHNLSKDYISGQYETMREKHEMSGTIGEVAVLALLERFAIREVGSETFYPFLANLRDDRRNTNGSTVNHGWDVSVFTQLEKTDPLLSYRTQVKVMRNGIGTRTEEVDKAGISRIYIDPDLSVSPTEHYVACRIMEECFGELNDPALYPDTTRKLDDRTTALLELLDT